MKEDNNFVSRVKRYSKVTTSLTSLATQFAGKKYLNFDLSDQKYAAQITEILGNLKGPLMKVAQLSATIPDLLPEEYARKLAELQSNAPPMSWVFVKRRMKAELGENWEDHFLSFDKEASLLLLWVRSIKPLFLIKIVSHANFNILIWLLQLKLILVN